MLWDFDHTNTIDSRKLFQTYITRISVGYSLIVGSNAPSVPHYW